MALVEAVFRAGRAATPDGHPRPSRSPQRVESAVSPRGPTAGPLTVIFTDVERSTELYTSRGDDVAGGVMDAHAAIVGEVTTRHGGWQIKSLGDGFLLAFASVRAALACAIGIQRATAADSQAHPERAVRVRIGINTGEVIRTDDDVDGQAVIAAARIMACAEPGEILVSRVVKDLTGTVPDVTFEDRGSVALKGFPEPWQLHAVTWPDMDVGHPTPTVGRRTTPALPVSSFVGRDEDTARVIALLDACRIVTVCGPGGVGKSRLARHVVHAVAERYDDGVIWVELGSMRDPADVPGALAAELRLNALVADALSARIVEVLAVRHQLIVFDTCEHLAEAVATLVESIGVAADRVDLLLTSREPLRADGEHVLTLAPLDESGAVALLVDRIQSTAPGWTSQAEDVDLVAEIARTRRPPPPGVGVGGRPGSGHGSARAARRSGAALRGPVPRPPDRGRAPPLAHGCRGLVVPAPDPPPARLVHPPRSVRRASRMGRDRPGLS